MSLGTDLLELQELDLERARTKSALAEMPLLRELAKKRATYTRLKAEATKLLAQRKDAETEVADLLAERQAAVDGVSAAQSRPLDAGDYRRVQELEDELSALAKRIDRAEHLLPDAQAAAKAAIEKEQQLLAYIKRFEASVVEDTKAARAEAKRLQDAVADIEARRSRVAARLPEDRLRAYEAAAVRFKGLAVEQLHGQVPSICRTTLQPASMDALRRAGEVTECPYCHRMLVRVEGELA